MVTVGTVLDQWKHALCWQRTKSKASSEGGADTCMEVLSFVLSQGAVFLSGSTNVLEKKCSRQKKQRMVHFKAADSEENF